MNGPARPAPPCAEREATARLVLLRARDAMDASGDAFLRRHLAACPECFADAVAVDPSLLFVRLSASAEAGETPAHAGPRVARGHREEPSDADLLAADVLAAIRVGVTEGGRRAAHPGRVSRHWLRAAAVILLASGLAAVLVLRRGGAPAPERGETSLAAVSGAAPRPLIEELESPGARVYEFAASTPQEPAVVFVANPDADL
jgi:hypothetical protein